MSNPRTTYEITADTKKAEDAISRLQKRNTTAFSKIGASIVVLNQGFELLGKAVRAVSGAMAEPVRLAEIQAQAERKLANALKIRGELTRTAISDIQKFNGALQQRVGVGDEELLQLQATLSAMGVHRDRLQAATKATLGLAAVTGSSLTESAKVAAKALTGNIGALKEYNIQATSVADASRQLVERFELVADKQQTASVRADVLRGNFGDLLEVIGKNVNESTALSAGLDAVSAGFIRIADWIKSNDGLVKRFFDTTFHAAATTAITLARGVLRTAQGLTALRGAANFLTGDVAGVNQAVEDAVALDKALEDLTQTQLELNAAIAGNPIVKPNKDGGEDPTAPASDEPSSPNADEIAAARKRKAEEARRLRAQELKERNEHLIRIREADDADAAHRLENLDREIDDANKAHDELSHVVESKREQQIADQKAFQDRVLQQQRGWFREWRDQAKEQAETWGDTAQEFFDQLSNFMGRVAKDIVDGLGAGITGAIEAVIEGGESLGEAAGKLLANIIKQIGQAMIGAGIGLIAAAPFTFGATLAQGLGLVAAGGAIVAAGSLLSAAVSPRESRPAAASRSSGGRGGARSTTGSPSFDPFGNTPSTQGGGNNIYMVNIGRGFVAGSPASVGREIESYIKESQRLTRG